MGIVYYGNYALYYELGRVELMREVGFTYRQLEEQGVLMPVTEYSIRYLRPAHYDDQVTIITTMRDLPVNRVTFWCELQSEDGQVLNAGHVRLAFLDARTRRAISAPPQLATLLRPYFK
jgi:acyl-CoA thioester hydrolase